MTALEISEIFTVWAINWPNAEMFQGGVDMLNMRCKLFAQHFSDIDYWDGLCGAALSLETRKYAPNIAEFAEDIKAAKEKIRQEIDQAYLNARSAILMAESFGEDPEQAIERLPARSKTVITVMGGYDAFVPPGQNYFNMDGFVRTYNGLLRKRNLLTGEKFESLPAGRNNALAGGERKTDDP